MINPDAMTFIEKTNEDPLLRVQIAELDIEGLLALAERQGYHFTKGEFIATLKAIAFGELQDEELENVAGGILTGAPVYPPTLGGFRNNGIIAVLIGL